jgi:hypothetical protein
MVEHAVKRLPLAGGQVEALVTGQEYPGWIVADGHSVYWANLTNVSTGSPLGEISKMDRDGGNRTTLSSQSTEILGIAVDATHVYWTGKTLAPGVQSAGSLSRVSLSMDGPIELLATGLDSVFDVVVDSKYVIWKDSRGIVRLAK